MIQPIGNRPVAMPKTDAFAAIATGMPNTRVATRKAATSAAIAAR